jgi:hypothetical protein
MQILLQTVKARKRAFYSAGDETAVTKAKFLLKNHRCSAQKRPGKRVMSFAAWQQFLSPWAA